MAALAQDLGTGVAWHVLHDDEVLLRRLIEARIEDLDDVGMYEPRRCQRLAAKARHERGVVGKVLGQQLDRDVAFQPLVHGQQHRRHAADADSALNPVAASDHRGYAHQNPPVVPAPDEPLPAPDVASVVLVVGVVPPLPPLSPAAPASPVPPLGGPVEVVG